ncbi:phosphomannomutase/phosphoglucomutase [Sulfurimonas sp. HSL-3221]|uniref:phosphomannomutase/phosphoglucomutase n=1 Tax=Sulfurimonadaceae TaxID=2771471 RepID=UPI001E41915D|nr:phosphomannomutase/phosphoglucomutase [Sulfurimonas sp. HSL-3221]UFS62260.1 phosphomannomutase/phosphoglucomutase [Sulfurimonas sp. HSL-3221]
MKSIFREYDIRGIFEKELNEETVKKIGYFLGQRIKKVGNIVAVGYDARLHSPKLSEYLTSGFNKAGLEVLNMGMVPTPVNYFSNFNAFGGVTPSASVMITGSHNPPEYNGFKITVDKQPFFGDDIYSLGDEVVAATELVIEDDTRCTQIDVATPYVDYMLKAFAPLKGMDKQLVIDCGNGAAGPVIEAIFRGLELNYEGLFCEPDGNFPNHHPDPTDVETLDAIKEKLSEGAELGFAYDGDADRIAVLTQENNIKGDILAILFARRMEKPTVIGEVKCSQVMYDELERLGGRGIMYKTGHSNLKVKIKETGADFAAEVSGHIFFNDRYFGYDDALYATLRVLELVHGGADLDAEIAALPKVYSTEEIKINTTEAEKFKTIEALKEALAHPPVDFPKIKDIITVDGIRVIFDDGWALVRASNTTPVLVTRYEAATPELCKTYEQKILALLASLT